MEKDKAALEAVIPATLVPKVKEAHKVLLADFHVKLSHAPAGKSSCAFRAGGSDIQVELKDGVPLAIETIDGVVVPSAEAGVIMIDDFLKAGFVRF